MKRKLIQILILVLSGFGIYALHNYLVLSEISDLRYGSIVSFGIYLTSGFIAGLINSIIKSKLELRIYFFLLPAILFDTIGLYGNHLLFPAYVPIITVVKVLGFYLGVNVLIRTKAFFIGLLISIPFLLYLILVFIPNFEYKKQVDTFIPKQKQVNYSLLRTLNGDTVDRNTLNGKVVLIDFYFMNCRPCREKFPTLEKLKSVFKHRNDVEIVGVYCNLDRSLEDLPLFLEYNKITLLTYTDLNLELKKDLGIKSFPVDMVINKKGEIVSTYWGFQMGASDKYFTDRVKLINELLKD